MRKKSNSGRFLAITCTLLFYLLSFLPNFVHGEDAVKEAEKDSVQGELKLEGKYIERLVLDRIGGGGREKIDQPKEVIKLQAGQYRLLEVRLTGRYTCHSWQIRDGRMVTVSEDKPELLKVGAPLKQIVKAKRQGSLLVLDYELQGVGGETYTSGDRSKPPKFTVYKGDKEIASGQFEFG